ncbi:methionyl-tRNA formyltransferase [Bifidobacterium aemilianum]|uniref:Methionyl-tRNA formyltransferase n=1 Tax=Bifidobacterium aemilianum TaxID=2493120 RepID=A0A366KAP5_9BIFI|nr:methionyl-tRNA formyltransferase [Bifidobacterium aemilianum]RBP98427.1 methionyl-tRNA formyltransferase [Bifidobacterium aemilianum]
MLKVLFAGTPEVAVPSLRVLAADQEHFEVVAVLTRPDAPQGRGRKLTPSPVKQAAQELGLPVLECNPNEPAFVDELVVTGAEAAAVVAYGRILKEDVLETLPMGWYNLHFSLLPQWRGAAPVQRAVWAGDKITGATVFRIDAGMDDGPILAQSTTEIGPHENAGQLLGRLAQDGAYLLSAALQGMADDQIQLTDQPDGSYEQAEKITADDAHIRFDVPCFAVDRQIRACTPNPGAWCLLHPKGTAQPSLAGSPDVPQVLHVLEARPSEADSEQTPKGLEPGKLLVTKKRIWVGTATEPLELLQVKAQGKKAMAAADWARGAHMSEDAFCE